jgi:ABC-type branched-subunit amino acid transport system ATPase component
VLGNLLVATERPAWWRPLADLVRPGRPSAATAAIERAVGVMGIGHLIGRSTSELSEGERKLVGLCRALVGSPRVVLLDEPAAGLDTAESRELGDRLQLVVADGITVLLVDHDMDLVLGVCDLVHVIERGQLIASGTPAEIRRDPRVVRAYLGTGATA